MSKKKYPVLTETICDDIENLKLVIEILTGKRVHLDKIDCSTGRGQVFVGDKHYPIEFCFPLGKKQRFRFSNSWYLFNFDTSVVIRIIQINSRCKNPPRWWVGTSVTNRWRENF